MQQQLIGRRRIFFMLCAAFALACALPSVANAQQTKPKQSAATRATAASATPLDIAINKAERQVMLTERAAKLYAQGALGISAARASVLMTETISLFDSELAWLKANPPSAAVSPSLVAQESAWAPLKMILAQPPTRESISRVASLSDGLLTKTKATSLAVAALTVNPFDEVVGQSAKQRVYIQRLGKLYMFERAGYRDAKQKFDATKAEFLAGHKALAESKEANDAIKRELDLIMGQAQMLFVNFVDGKVGGAQNDALVGKSIEVMMQMQDAVTTLFERL